MTEQDHDPCAWGGRRKVLRWPAMIDRDARQYWPQTKRGFTVNWTMEPEPDPLVLDIVLRDYWLVIDVMAGAVMIRDAATAWMVPAGQSVAVSSRRFEMQLAGVGAGARLKVFLFSRLPFRDVVFANPLLLQLLHKCLPMAGCLPGIFPLGGVKRMNCQLGPEVDRSNPGVRLLVHHIIQSELFGRFLASGPLQRHIGVDLPECPGPLPCQIGYGDRNGEPGCAT